MAGAYLEMYCCKQGTKLPLEKGALEKDFCEYEDFCPLGKLRTRVRVAAKGVLARAICECGTNNVGLVKHEETQS